MPSLQALIDATAPGGTLDLKNSVFNISEPPIARGPITITGQGAVIRSVASDLRKRQNLICRGGYVNLTGRVLVVGNKPDLAPYDPDLEAQHGVELIGVTEFVMDGWTVRNTWGDALYAGKSGTGRWSKRLTIRNLTTNEIGRQHVTLDAVEDVLVTTFNLGVGWRSVFDIEPPGSDWGAKRVKIDTGIVTSKRGYLLSCMGVGSMNSVTDIVLSNIKCVGRGAGVMVNPPASVRRANFSILKVTSDQRAMKTPPFRFNRTDGILVRGCSVPTAPGVPVLETNDCTDIWSDVETKEN